MHALDRCDGVTRTITYEGHTTNGEVSLAVGYAEERELVFRRCRATEHRILAEHGMVTVCHAVGLTDIIYVWDAIDTLVKRPVAQEVCLRTGKYAVVVLADVILCKCSTP